MELAIRPATIADLAALEWDGEYRHYRRLNERALSEARNGRRILLLAESEGQIVGQLFVQLGTKPALRAASGASAYLYAFRVKAAHRNHGIGTRLILEAEQRLRRLGYRRAVLSVAKQNPSALRLYRRLKYRVFAEDPGQWSYLDHQGVLRQVSEPALVLEKSL